MKHVQSKPLISSLARFLWGRPCVTQVGKLLFKKNMTPLCSIAYRTWLIFRLAKRLWPLNGSWKPNLWWIPPGCIWKAWLVARGIERRLGINYGKTFASIVKWTTLRTIITLAVSLGWDLHHMNVVTTFLNGILEELIFMRQPLGFQVFGSEHLVYRLKRSIYGLKQSSMMWYFEIDSYLLFVGWAQSFVDPSLYFVREFGTFIILILFIDDLLVTGNNPTCISQIKAILQEKY